MPRDRKPVFIAYGGADRDLSEAIRDAAKRANSAQDTHDFRSWERNDIAGRPLASPIYEHINASALVVCDITHPNLNVI